MLKSIRHLDYVVLLCRDISLMKKFYNSVMGFPIHVNVLTDLPGITPAMWHWWFGWHGDDSNKYELWHPKAHHGAVWQDQIVGRQAYIGRVSLVDETISQKAEKIAIHFQKPSSIGYPILMTIRQARFTL